MVITILTLFPEIFRDIFSSSIIGRSQKKGCVIIRLINIRDFTFDKHKSVDDKPYGGGVGMLMQVDVLERAIESSKLKVKKSRRSELRAKTSLKEKVILLDPKGKLYTQTRASQYSKLDHLILVCGHYEGIDARITHFVDESLSIGNYVLTGGEIPAMVVADSLIRLIPGVLSKKEATLVESFSNGNNLEPPQYTRPPVYKGYKVPKVLLSGNHLAIRKWQKKHSTY